MFKMTSQFKPLLAITLALAQAGAFASEFPLKPVRFVVGGGSDVPARVVADYMTKAWKTQVNVEPIPSAGGVVAAQTVKDSAADGHTLLNSTGAYLLNQAARNPPPYVMGKDFMPVGLLGTAPQIVVVPPNLPVKNLAELIAYANARPNYVNCASAGIGGSSHLACEMLRHYGKADITHVPYKGVAPALVDVMAGRIQVTYTAVAAVSAIKEGRLRAIAVTGTHRLAALPNVPTVAEQSLPQLTLLTWYGIHAPAGTPAPVIETISKVVAAAIKDPAVNQALVATGLEPQAMSAVEFRKFMENQEATITRLWRETGAKLY